MGLLINLSELIVTSQSKYFLTIGMLKIFLCAKGDRSQENLSNLPTIRLHAIMRLTQLRVTLLQTGIINYPSEMKNSILANHLQPDSLL